jgi:hypothetical protein
VSWFSRLRKAQPKPVVPVIAPAPTPDKVKKASKKTAKKPLHQAYNAIEDTMMAAVAATVTPRSEKLISGVRQALVRDDFAEAHRLVDTFTLTPAIARHLRDVIGREFAKASPVPVRAPVQRKQLIRFAFNSVDATIAGGLHIVGPQKYRHRLSYALAGRSKVQSIALCYFPSTGCFLASACFAAASSARNCS